MNLEQISGMARKAPSLRGGAAWVRVEPGDCAAGAARSKRAIRGFTLIEIMMVVAILGVILAMGIPSIYHMVNKEGMVSAIRDVTELCRNARARAVFRETTVELHINPRDGSMSLNGGGLASGAEGSFTKTSAQLSDRVRIELLGVNFEDFTEADEGVVDFYANGTSDEFTIVLQAQNGEEKKISLEVVTALAEVQTLSYENRR